MPPLANPPVRSRRRAPALAGAAFFAAVAVVPAGPAQAVVLEVAPGLGAGVTNNATGAATNQIPNQYEAYGSVRGAAALVATGAVGVHRLGYMFQMTNYAESRIADNTSHDVRWQSALNLSARTELSLGANTALYRYSAIPTTDPSGGNTISAPIGTPATSVVNAGANQTLTYQPTGRVRYAQALVAGYIKPLDETNQVPNMLTLTATGRGEWGAGRDALTLTAMVTDMFRLDEPAIAPASNYQLMSQLLGGYRRELSANASVEGQAGALAFFDTTAGAVAMGPAGAATGTYRRLPWFATLILMHAPTVNIYSAEAIIADSATARLSLPLNRRETLIIAGFGGYTYARRVTGQSHFVFAPRIYDLFTLGGSLTYRFEKMPFIVALDYLATTQRGSITDGTTPDMGQRVYPSTLRRFIGLTVYGTLAWGEGQHGFMRQ